MYILVLKAVLKSILKNVSVLDLAQSWKGKEGFLRIKFKWRQDQFKEGLANTTTIYILGKG